MCYDGLSGEGCTVLSLLECGFRPLPSLLFIPAGRTKSSPWVLSNCGLRWVWAVSPGQNTALLRHEALSSVAGKWGGGGGKGDREGETERLLELEERRVWRRTR